MDFNANTNHDCYPTIAQMLEITRKSEFPNLKDNVYLDHAGATLYSKSQMDAVYQDLLQNLYGNPHTRNTSSLVTSEIIDQVRSRVVEHFNTTLDEYHVIFTSGATAALKLVAESFRFGNDQTSSCSGTFSFLIDNHTSVVGMRELAAVRGAKIHCLDLDTAGKELNNNNQSNVVKMSADGVVNNLFVYPAQSNFSGDKYPLEWIDVVQRGALNNCADTAFDSRWFCMLDAASYVSTSHLDLDIFKPDFVCLSFYKMFGYPTGVGALLVHRDSAHLLDDKRYFGGGTVSMSINSERCHIFKSEISERFEDGTLSFLDIISLRHGFDTFMKLTGGIMQVLTHTHSLAHYTYKDLSSFVHGNGVHVAEIYSQSKFESFTLQGAILTFNLKYSSGDYVGFTEVEKMSSLHNIHLRTGCFCNAGACQHYLNLSPDDVKTNFKAGYVCGGEVCLVNGHPTGAVRISFGYMSTVSDADKFLEMIKSCFVDSKISSICRDELISDRVNEENSVESPLALSHMFIYPVKSCSAQAVDWWFVGSHGLLYDRQWMIIKDSGIALNLKREPKLYSIRPIVDLESGVLTLYNDKLPPISIPLDVNMMIAEIYGATICTSKVCNARVKGYDCGDEVASWLEECLNMVGCRMLRQIPGSRRDAEMGDELTFVNDSQYTLISDASLNWLCRKLQLAYPDDDHWEFTAIMKRFRPNFVVNGVINKFHEECWKNFTIGNVSFKMVKPCTRCQVIGVDERSELKHKEPLKTLVYERGQQIPFGINFTHDFDKNVDKIEIKVGDPFVVSVSINF